MYLVPGGTVQVRCAAKQTTGGLKVRGQSLRKGEVLELSGSNVLRQAIVGIGWVLRKNQSSNPLVVDAQAIPRDKSGVAIAIVSRDNAKDGLKDRINLQAEWCDHLGALRSGIQDNEQIRVDPIYAPSEVAAVDFCITIRDAAKKQQHLGMLKSVFLRIVNTETSEEVLRCDLTSDSLSNHAGIIVGRLVHSDGGWQFKVTADVRPEFDTVENIAASTLPTL